MAEPSPNSPTVFPPEYPLTYSQHVCFRGAEKRLPFLPLDMGDVTICSKSELLKNRLLVDFDRSPIERSGVMLGEYAVLEDGLILIDRKGTPISINFPDAFLTSRMVFDSVNTHEFWGRRQFLLDNWDAMPLIERATVFSHIYHNNYYHFTFEFMQNFRLLEPYDVREVIIPRAILRLNFQIDLARRGLAGRRVVYPDAPARVRDPVIVQSWQSYEGLRWIRGLMGIRSAPGSRRYFIRRSPAKSRNGNNIAETPEFRRFLAKWNFEAIDFGNGDLSIEAQIRLIDEAAVILAPHGAGMTNLAYLNPPLTIIETFSRHVLSASFIQIAVALGFKYYGIIAENVDEAGSILPDVPQLEAIMEETVRHQSGNASR